MKVIAAPTVEPISLDTLRMHCRIDDDTEDALLAIYLSGARELAEAFLGFAVAATTVESLYTTFPTGSIPLEAAPVLSIASIVYIDALGASQTLASSAYSLDTQTGAVAFAEAWPVGAAAVRVRYVIGFSAEGDDPQVAPLPRSIMAAILLTAGHLYRNREDTAAEALQALPMGASHLLMPLRTRMGFA